MDANGHLTCDMPITGRPRYNFTLQEIQQHIENGNSWSGISRALGIRRNMNISPRYTAITDQELSVLLQEILHVLPQAGERIIRGALAGRHVCVPRAMLRRLLNEVDRFGRAARRSRPIQRRTYSVSGPNKLWHVDTDHKLISWWFVIHSCVDGFSRVFLYLCCCLDNTSSTAFKCFQEGVQEFGIPSRVRGDHGTENYNIARFMLRIRGYNRGSFISGRSVHNQRVEHMWWHVNRLAVTAHYREIFSLMKYNGILNSTNESHMYCLHYVFLPRIQQSLDEIQRSWNNHPMKTEQETSPLAFWRGGMHSGLGPADVSVHDIENAMQACEDNENIILTNNHVVVPQPILDLTIEELDMIRQVDPLSNDGNYGIQNFIRCCEILIGQQQ